MPGSDPTLYAIKSAFLASAASAGEACIEWPYSRDKYGYGQFDSGRIRRAHRVSYATHVGPIPFGMCVCHKCDNPCCINPAHLFVASHTENMHDMISKGRGNVLALGGRDNRGERHGRSRLTERDVIEIRKVFAEREDVPLSSMAKAYGVSRKTIEDAATWKTWAHI